MVFVEGSTSNSAAMGTYPTAISRKLEGDEGAFGDFERVHEKLWTWSFRCFRADSLCDSDAGKESNLRSEEKGKVLIDFRDKLDMQKDALES